MPKVGVTIPINSHLLRGAIQRRTTLVEAASKLGVSRQALNAWLNEERIPPRRMIDLSQALDFDTKEVAAILDKQVSVKDLARELAEVREENMRLKQAIHALLAKGDGE